MSPSAFIVGKNVAVLLDKKILFNSLHDLLLGSKIISLDNNNLSFSNSLNINL